MRLVGCIVEERVDQALEVMADTAHLVDFFELRLDHLMAGDCGDIINSSPRPLIVTNRPAREGGRFEGPEGQRLATLKKALSQGAAMVDLELSAGREAIAEFLAFKGHARLILSHHDFEKTPSSEELIAILERINAAGADVAKIVTTAHVPGDLERLAKLLDVAAHMSQEAAIFAMGPFSQPSRMLTPLLGSALSYGALSDQKMAAPGQTTIEEFRRVFPMGRILPVKPALFGIIGSPVGHSLSPAMHNAAFDILGLKDHYYVPLDVAEIKPAMELARLMDFQGLSVTTPHKRSVVKYVSALTEEARAIGAVNTLTRAGKGWIGGNTDWQGVADALQAKTDLDGARALVAGAGGAARAAAYGLGRAGAEVWITNRTEPKGREMAREMGFSFVSARQLSGFEAKILVNATPLGMGAFTGYTPFPAAMLASGQAILDMVYHPRQTRLMAEARAAGAIALGGVEMLLYQALGQFESWVGEKAPREAMAAALAQMEE